MTDSDAGTIQTYRYEMKPVENGYAGRTLYVNLDTDTLSERAVNDEMKEKFIGGRGFDLWLMWNGLPSDGPTAWNDPANELCIASGPLGGTTIYPGSGKSIVTTISPLTGSVMDSNVGGYFGPYLKFAGFDALEIQGKADEDVIVIIDGDEGEIRIERADDSLPELADELSTTLTERFGKEKKRAVSVVSAGPGAEHSYFGCLNFSWYDQKRGVVRVKQAGRGGTGTVFRDKSLKALVVKYSDLGLRSNNPADLDALKEVGRKHSKEICELDEKQNEMATIGTTHIVQIMNDYDLLPTKNYQYGEHELASNINHEVYREKFDPGFDGCWVGCTVACAHGVRDFIPVSGPKKGERVFVDGPEYETIAGCGSNCGIFDPDHIIEMNYYCDVYGLDTISVGTATAFVMECFERGLLDETITGMDLSFGNKRSALTLLHQMASGSGFGTTVGRGIRYMKERFAEDHGVDLQIMTDIGMESKGLEFSEYMTKESLAQQGGYGLTLKGPQHDEAWLIFLDMVHGFMPTFEDKAEALHWFPMWRTWFGLCGLCKLPWNDIVPEDNKEMEEPAKVTKHVQWYADYFTAVTGREVDPDDLIRMSERVYNFQRIFNLRQGFGTREHDTVPYRAVGPATVEEYESRVERYDGQLEERLEVDPAGKSTEEKLRILREYREEQYEKLTDAVYTRRGWDEDGVPTKETVEALEIDYPEVFTLLEVHRAQRSGAGQNQ